MAKAFVTTYIYDCELFFNSIDGTSTEILKDTIKYIIVEHDYRKAIMPVMYMKVNLIPSVYNKMVPEQGKSKLYLKLYRTRRKGSTSATAKKVIYDDEFASEIDVTFSTLMGDKVEPRREFIEENAKFVKNIDF